MKVPGPMAESPSIQAPPWKKTATGEPPLGTEAGW